MSDKLLVLEDEPVILTSLEHLFEEDYEVFTACDAKRALQLATEHDIAVILCDERMPGVSGHEFLQSVRIVSKATRVMISGYADLEAITEAVNNGQIFAYVSKPWDPLALKATVKAAAAQFTLVREVEQERALLRTLTESIPDLVYFKDCQSRYTRVNHAHLRVLGAKDSAECMGKSAADYFEPQDALRWRLQEEEIMRSGRPQFDLIEQLHKPGGGSRWTSTTKVPTYDRSGKLSGIACITRDITALKNSEKLLREQNERNRMVLETASDPFIGMDPDGSITAWNPRAEKTFGWTAAEIVGRKLCDTVIAPAHREAHALGVEHFLSENCALQGQPIDLVAVHRNGREFPVEATVWPVRVGGVCSFNAFVRDISERRRVEEARTRESKLIQLLQSVTVAANESSTIENAAQLCLDKICSYTGWPVGHVYLRDDKSSAELISAGVWHIDDRGPFTAFRDASDRCHFDNGMGLLGRVLASGKPQWTLNLADDKAFSARARVGWEAGLRSGCGFPILVDKNVAGVLEFFSTQTTQADEELLTIMEHIGSQLGQVIIRQRGEEHLQRAKTAAESASQAKSQFLTTMSHEMRTPMNAILGMADLLMEGSLSEEQLGYVRIFQKSGANLLHLLNDILDLSKVESGHFELESIGFDLRALVQKVIEMMTVPAHDRGLQLHLEVLPDVPLGLLGDPNRLRQILVNLIGNAVKFTARGSVTVRVEREQGAVSEGEPACSLRFSVVDTGIGIAADKTEMIFDRFTQADSSTTRKYGGTGLGLPISKGLAELMGGRVGCTSEIGKGSTFFFTARFDTGQEMETPEIAQPAAIVAPRAASAGTRILIAEDAEYNLLLVKAYLKDTGYQLDVAVNGKIAVEKVISGHPDLVLMDLEMPVMDGLEATRAIRRWEVETHAPPVPILALTAHAAGEEAGRSLEAGCTEHLTKPIKKSILLEAIARHIDGKIHITPPPGIEELVPSYLAGIRHDMGEILASVDSNDRNVVRRLAHQFKGSGEGYGFPEITRAGAALELAALTANEHEIRTQILALAAYLDRVKIVV